MKNLTNIIFNEEEMQLLKYGLNYSIVRPTTTYFVNLLAETERAIKLLDGKMQNTYRILAANKLKQIINTSQKETLCKKVNYM
jgi:pantothenate kinase